MSADEFDPFIERLFARAPHMADASRFAAGVDARLDSSTRMRTVALSLAGLIGGVVAVRETMTANLGFTSSDGPVAGRALGNGLDSVVVGGQQLVGSGLREMGLSELAMGSMAGAQMFWVAAGALIAVAAVAAVKLSQEI